MKPTAVSADLLQNIAAVITQARDQVRTAVNSAMVQAYWEIGRLIVEYEQQGEKRAIYGKQQLQNLSDTLTTQFGKGFDITNLRNMRQFYLTFPIRDSVRRELSWTHYRRLLRVENEQARQWYLNEAVNQNWSARALDRQISLVGWVVKPDICGQLNGLCWVFNPTYAVANKTNRRISDDVWQVGLPNPTFADD